MKAETKSASYALRLAATSRRRFLLLASSARVFVVSELQEIVLQSFQRVALLIEVVPQVVRLLEHILAVIDYALADEGRHAESSQRRTSGSAQVMRHECSDAVREKSR